MRSLYLAHLDPAAQLATHMSLTVYAQAGGPLLAAQPAAVQAPTVAQPQEHKQ